MEDAELIFKFGEMLEEKFKSFSDNVRTELKESEEKQDQRHWHLENQISELALKIENTASKESDERKILEARTREDVIRLNEKIDGVEKRNIDGHEKLKEDIIELQNRPAKNTQNFVKRIKDVIIGALITSTIGLLVTYIITNLTKKP